MSDPIKTEIVARESNSPVVQQSEPSVASMLQEVIRGGITPENVGALEKLCDLHERMLDRSASVQYAQDFAALQSDIPSIKAIKPVPNRDGSVRYRFAPYEEIMAQVRPLLQKHGFSVSYNTDWDGPRIVVSCTLQHRGGHSVTNKFAARVGDGPPQSSPAQADGAVKTYAKRGALCDALNIVVDHDTDGREDAKVIGAFVTPEQAANLRELAEAVEADAEKLFRFAGASSFETIPADRFDEVFAALKKKERAR